MVCVIVTFIRVVYGSMIYMSVPQTPTAAPAKTQPARQSAKNFPELISNK